jgi:hypothetical protein
VSYDIAVPFTPEEKAKLQAKATAQVRSVSSFVAKLIVADLGRG